MPPLPTEPTERVSGDEPKLSPSVAVEAASSITAARAPLRLDSRTLQAAVNDSRGAIARMAQASGRELSVEQSGSQERLASDMAAAGKRECLAPNESGTLLSLPVMALAAISGKCK